MNYLPELRATLIRAAQRQAAAGALGRAKRRSRRSRPSLGAIATVLASVATVAVAALAIAVIGHGGHGGGSAASSAASNRAAARAAAVRVLGQVVLPAGAVALHSDPTGQLGSLPDRLGTAYVVDRHRFWRVPGGPASIIRFIRAHRPPGSRDASGSQAGSGQASRAGSRKPGTFHIDHATEVFSYRLAPGGIIAREVAVEAVAIAGGASLVRVDGEAGGLLARPAGEQIPGGVILAQVTVRKTAAGRKPVHRTRLITSPRRIFELTVLLNTLPRAQRPSGVCVRGSVSIRFAFYAPGTAPPVALANADLSCPVVRLSIGGRPQPDLAFGVLNGDPRGELAKIKALLSFAPRP